MDSIDLLERENEFKKLNKQLEKKTEKLMKEIESVMQKPDIFSDFSHNISLRLNNNEKNIKKHFCSSPKQEPETPNSFRKIKNVTNYQKEKELKNNLEKSDCINQNKNTSQFFSKDVASTEKVLVNEVDVEKQPTLENQLIDKVACVCCSQSKKEKIDPDLEFLYAFVSVSVKEKILPEFFLKGEVTIENICKCLSSKVRLLQEEVEKLQSTLKKKDNQCTGHMTKLAEMESERLTLLNRSSSCSSTVVEMRNKCAALQARFEEKDRLYKEQRTETDKLSSEVKRLKSKVNNLEAKFASSQQTVDNLTAQLQVAKKLEKEYRENSRSNISTHQSTITSLEQVIKRQSTRIDRQTSLIDNLRRQIAILTTEMCLGAFEKDYSSFLMQEIK